MSLGLTTTLGKAGLTFIALAPALLGQDYEWTTFAGSSLERGIADGAPELARFEAPFGVAVDADGSVYVTDNNNVRRITPDGFVTRIAGAAERAGSHADGAGTQARFFGLRGVAVDKAGNLFIADANNHVVRKVTPSGVVSTVAGLPSVPGKVDGIALNARFDRPHGIAVDQLGNVFVSEAGNKLVRKITTEGVVTTWAGAPGSPPIFVHGIERPGTLNSPSGMAIDSAQTLYVADGVVRAISPQGQVNALRASWGPLPPYPALPTGLTGSTAGIAVDAQNRLFVADAHSQSVSMLVGDSATVIAGGNNRPQVTFGWPTGIAVDAVGNLYVAEQVGCRIRKGTPWTTPVVTAAPGTYSPEPGGVATLSVLVAGISGTTLQWYRDGVPISGATGRTLRIPQTQLSDEGTYTVVATNRLGSAQTIAGTIAMSRPPLITAQPQSGVLDRGNMTLNVGANGPGPLQYQWFNAGTPVAGATSASLRATVPGIYTAVVANAFGTVTSAPAQIWSQTRLMNLAMRTNVAPSEPLVVGFVVRGVRGGRKQLLIRGIGPALAGFGIPEALSRTQVTVFDQGAAIANNDGWNQLGEAAMSAAFRGVGAFPLAPGSGDSALLLELEPGPYTAQVASAGEERGTAMVEVYEREAAVPELSNLAARGRIDASTPLIVGVVITGRDPVRVLVRGIGPSLRNFGVTDAVAGLSLRVFRNGELVAANRRWDSLPERAEILAAMAAVGAFAVAPDGGDAALLLNLPPGNYTAEAQGESVEPGSALVEIYRAD